MIVCEENFEPFVVLDAILAFTTSSTITLLVPLKYVSTKYPVMV